MSLSKLFGFYLLKLGCSGIKYILVINKIMEK